MFYTGLFLHRMIDYGPGVASITVWLDVNYDYSEREATFGFSYDQQAYVSSSAVFTIRQGSYQY